MLLCVAFSATSLFYNLSHAQTGHVEISFEEFGFIEGNWAGTFRGDRDYEAYWSTPTGNAIMGMIRFIRDDQTILFELLSIERTERGMILSVKHFTPGLVGRQEREDAVRYRLIEIGNNRAVFEHEENGSLLAWEGGFDRVSRGERENGQLVWTDLFVGRRIK